MNERAIPNDTLIPKIAQFVDEGHTVTLLLKGFSMRPFLEDRRDKALLAKTKQFKVGDVVLAKTLDGHYVLHRIVSIDGDLVTLLGDGNLTIEQCHANDIYATAIGFYRKGSNHLCSTNSMKWQTYSRIWMKLRPMRRLLLAIYRRYYNITHS